MFKTLAGKAIVPVAVTLAGFLAVCCLLLYGHMKSDRIEESILRAHDISGVLVKSTRYAMLKDDRETLRNIVSNVGEETIVEHVRIFNKGGRIAFSSASDEVGQLVDKDAEGCYVCHSGNRPAESLGPMEQARRYVNELDDPVLAITEPLYNDPECWNAECHYHAPEQRVLGTLDVGLSEKPLQRELQTLRSRLLGFGVMVLILSVGGVAALLRVNVVGPIGRLERYVKRLAQGETVPPPRGLEEVAGIAEAAFDLRRAGEEDPGGDQRSPGGGDPVR